MKTLIKTLYEEFGISQQQLADLAGVHFSLISHVRTGNRLLPAEAIQRLSHVIQALQKVKAGKPQPSKINKALLLQRRQYLEEQILDQRIQIHELQTTLAKAKQQERACSNLAALLSHLTTGGHHLPEERFQRWRNEARYNMQQQSKKCSSDAAWQLEKKIEVLAVLLAYYEKQLTVIKNQINKS